MRSPSFYADRLRAARQRRDVNYRLRILGSLAATIALAIGVAHLPLDSPPRAIGWYLTQAVPPAIDLMEEPGTTDADLDALAPPVTRHRSEGADTPEDEPGLDMPDPVPAAPPPPEPVPGRALLAGAEAASRIVGGLGAFYIHIEYPEEAIRADIQGRLMLHFTIAPDGRARDIRVAQPLHPLTDSAAVRALRRTRFIPARTDGEPVPMRVQLPVRFRIETPAPPRDTTDATRNRAR